MNELIYIINYCTDESKTDATFDTIAIHISVPSSQSLDVFPTDYVIEHAKCVIPSVSLRTFFDDYLPESIRALPLERSGSKTIVRLRAINRKLFEIGRYVHLGQYYLVASSGGRVLCESVITETYDNETSTFTFPEQLPFEIDGKPTDFEYMLPRSVHRIRSVPMVMKGEMMEYMFSECHLLMDIAGLANWDVSDATSMVGTFAMCQLLSCIDVLSMWDMSNVTNISSMFYRCWSLKTVSALAGWDVHNVRLMDRTFAHTRVVSVDELSEWDVSNVLSMDGTFAFSHLDDTDGMSDWDVHSVRSMIGMFRECWRLTSVEGLRRWNVHNVVTMDDMFEGCRKNLCSIEPLREWNVRHVELARRMFKGCRALECASVKREWVSKMRKLKDGMDMFEGVKDEEK